MNDSTHSRWDKDVRAAYGLLPLEPDDFMVEAEQMIRHEDLELVGSVVLHCFQKKSHSGSESPKEEMEMIHARLKVARNHTEGAPK